MSLCSKEGKKKNKKEKKSTKKDRGYKGKASVHGVSQQHARYECSIRMVLN